MGLNSVIFLAVDPEIVNKALLNTVMCIIVVFTLLFFFSATISLFKYIGKADAYFKNKKAVIEPLTVAEPELEDVIEEDELSDDLKLIAVITAAISSYEEAMGTPVPADGLVVRSIRKSNKSKWQNA